MKTLSKHWGTIVVIALAIGAVVYWLAVDRKSITSAELEDRKRNLLPAWRVDDVTRVSFKSADGELVVSATPTASGEGKTWNVTSGGATYPADEQSVDTILGTLQYALFKREIPKGSIDRAAFGLEPPRATVEITMGEVRLSLAIGGPAAIAEETYAEVKDRGVYAISSKLAASVVPSAGRSPIEDVRPVLLDRSFGDLDPWRGW